MPEFAVNKPETLQAATGPRYILLDDDGDEVRRGRLSLGCEIDYPVPCTVSVEVAPGMWMSIFFSEWSNIVVNERPVVDIEFSSGRQVLMDESQLNKETT